MPNNKQKKGKAPKRAAATITVRAAARPRPKQGKNAKKKAAKRGGNQLHLSPCAIDYASCLLNPCGSIPSCMPTTGGVLSRKIKPFARGTLATSTVVANQGNGFILVSPSLGLCSDNVWALCSDVPWVGPALPATWTTGTGILGVGSNSDYLVNSFATAGTAARLVSLCVRVRYAGTELNRGGAVFGLTEPDHVSLGGRTLTDLRKYTQCAETKVTEGWTEIVYTGPVNPTEFEYNNSLIAPSIVPNSQPMMAFWIRSATPGVIFDWEIWANYEVIGPNVNGKSPSFADPVGLNIVTSGAMTAAGNGQTGHHGGGTFLNKAIGAMGTVAQAALTHVGSSGPVGIDSLIKTLLPRLTARALPAIMGRM